MSEEKREREKGQHSESEELREAERGPLPPDLLLRIKFFIRDLLAFQSDEGARHRLTDDPSADFYMSAAYFSSVEANMLLLVPSPTQTEVLNLRQALQEVLLRKAKQGDHGVCTSHDLAPIIQRWFGARKGFQNEPSFRKELKRFLRTSAHSCGPSA